MVSMHQLIGHRVILRRTLRAGFAVLGEPAEIGAAAAVAFLNHEVIAPVLAVMQTVVEEIGVVLQGIRPHPHIQGRAVHRL